jgi:hypothetical protein
MKEKKDYQSSLDTLVNVPTGDGFVGDFSKYRKAITDLQRIVDKEKPMKVIYKVTLWSKHECPKCHESIDCDDDYYNWHMNYCPHCGQRLDWKGEEKK